MPPSTYIDALRRARDDLAQAIRERDRLNLEILRLQQLVKALAYQASKQHDATPAAAENSADTIGFTEAVLTIIRSSEDALTARNIRDRLVELGYELGRYSNPLGFVHSVLGRLVTQGKIRESQPGVYVFNSPLYQALWTTGYSQSPGSADLVPGAAPKQSKEDAFDQISVSLGLGPSQGDVVPGEMPPPPKLADEKSPKK